jgi:hypothetical protein
MLLNEQWVRNEKENLKIHETNANENSVYHKLWDTVKAVLSGKFIATKHFSNT